MPAGDVVLLDTGTFTTTTSGAGPELIVFLATPEPGAYVVRFDINDVGPGVDLDLLVSVPVGDAPSGRQLRLPVVGSADNAFTAVEIGPLLVVNVPFYTGLDVSVDQQTGATGVPIPWSVMAVYGNTP